VLSGFQDIEAEAEAAGEEYFESRMNREASSLSDLMGLAGVE